ncbi:MAG: DNA-binding response OmpR family regulator [Candidatus Latescibacterota bacterium]
MPILETWVFPFNKVEYQTLMARIAIIEDDENVGNTIVKVLERAGYQMVLFVDAAKAISDCDWSQIDLVMTDLVMSTSGEELIEFVQQEKPQIPIVVITGVVGDRLERVREFDVVRVLKKPFHPRDLLSTVREILPQED